MGEMGLSGFGGSCKISHFRLPLGKSRNFSGFFSIGGNRKGKGEKERKERKKRGKKEKKEKKKEEKRREERREREIRKKIKRFGKEGTKKLGFPRIREDTRAERFFY